MSTELEVVQRAIENINAVSEGLADLKKNYAGVVYDVSTSLGMNLAKEARLAIRNPRYTVEKIRKDAKAPIIALGKQLDAEAARITGELLKIEEPISEQIKNEEDRKERERVARIEAELKRVADLQERVTELRGNERLTPMDGSGLIAEHISDLERIAVDDSFEEFRQQAEDAKAVGIARLRAHYRAALDYEAEQARILKEREELAALRASEERRQAEDRARLAEEERQAKVLRDAEAEKQKEALRLEREEFEARIAEQAKRDADERAQRAKDERAAKALRDAEEARIAAEREKLEQEQADARRVSEEAERARVAAVEAHRQRKDEAAKASKKSKYPGEPAIVEALGKHFGVTESVVRTWLIELRKAQ